MKLLNTQPNPEIYFASQERRKKILLVMHAICIIVFLALCITDFYSAHYTLIPFNAVILLLILLSFFKFYKKASYEKASYTIVFVLAISTLGVAITSQFNNFSPAFIFPFILGAFSLFSWKKGLLLSSIPLLGLLFSILFYGEYFQTSAFLQNTLSMLNFVFLLIIILIFAFYYETTRIDAYKKLINANYKKELLYAEIHHRVKNNLNIVSSMLAIQAEKEDEKIQDIIKISKNRIDSIAMVHSMLYISNDIEKVNAKLFIEKLALTLQSTIDNNVSMVFKIKALELSLNEIIPIGLIINELLTNSFKYAFTNTLNPKITIVLQILKNSVLLTYHDNGIGYWKSGYTQGLGLKLVALNVKQLKGFLKIKYIHGLCYKITYQRSLHV